MKESQKITKVGDRSTGGESAGAGIGGGGEAGSGVDQVATIDESMRTVITEAEVLRVPEGGKLLLREGARLTPLAADQIRSRRITVRYRVDRSPGGRRLIAIGADHGGFEFKSKVAELLVETGCQVRDFGTHSPEPVDYPDIAHAVARAVADGTCDLGILLDGAGIGSCMAANKVPGIRAALCYDEASARNSREHNYANVLTLGAKLQSLPMILAIVTTWIATPTGEERHGRRVAGIMAIERQYLR